MATWTSNIAPPTLFWTLTIGCGGLLLLSAWLAVRRRTTKPIRVTKPAASSQPLGCMQCGYDSFGLDSGICPECGNDLGTTGLAPAMFVRTRFIAPWMRCIVWSVCVILIGLASFGAARDWLPSERMVTSMMTARHEESVPPDYRRELQQMIDPNDQRGIRYVSPTYWPYEIMLTTTHGQRVAKTRWRPSDPEAVLDGLKPADSAQLTITLNTLRPLHAQSPFVSYLIISKSTVPIAIGPHSGDVVTAALLEAGVAEAPQLGASAQLWIDDPLRAEAMRFQGSEHARFGRATSGGGPWQMQWSTLVPVFAWWVLVWLAGMPMMRRRRPVVGVAFEPAPALSRVATN